MNKIFALLLGGLALVACTEHTEYDDTGFSAVEKLLYPSDAAEVTLIEQADANLYFEWEVSKVGTPVYTVVFMDADKKEVGRYLADNNGQKASLKLLHSDLNEIAGNAGIEPSAAGDLYWTVCAGNGGAEQLSAASPHRLSVVRYASVAAPYHLYLTGAGTEYGAEAAAAAPMTELGDGKFELVANLNGAFGFVNRNAAGNKRTFGVSDAGRLTEGGDAAGQSTLGPCYILVDFAAGTVAVKKIEKVELIRAGTNKDGAALCELPFVNGVVWSNPSYTVPTDGDDRYRFRATLSAEEPEYLIFGSASGRDAQAPESLIPGDYFKLYVHGTDIVNDSYARIFKFFAPVKGMTVKLTVDMKQGLHEFDLGFDMPELAAPVLSAPAANSALRLTTIGSDVAFSWNDPTTGDAAGLKLITYSVVFYKDAAGTQAISTRNVETAKTLSLKHTDLESIAADAGIAAEKQGDIYWGVTSKLMGKTLQSSVNKLTLTRMAGVPAALYISGAASEYGSEYKALKVLGAGKFEIYTKLSAGTYTITDGTTSEARRFSVADGKFVESSAAITSTEESLYRITLDYMNATATYEKITGDVYMQIAAWKEKKYTLAYMGDGVWNTGTIAPDFTREPSWNGDTRFFVKMTIDGVEYKLAHQRDFGGSDPTDTKAEGTDERYFVQFWTDASDWDYNYKVHQQYRGGNTKRLSLKLNLGTTVENPYIYFTYLDL